MFPVSENVLVPVPGVRVFEQFWEHSELGVRIPAPPWEISDRSSASEIASAAQAADLGMASIRISPNGNRPFRRRGPLSLVAAVPLKKGTGAALGQTAWVALVGIRLPLALFLFGGVGAQLAHQPVLVFLSGAGFYLMTSLVLHECAHVLAYRLLAGPEACAVLVRSATRLRVVRVVLPSSRDIMVTLAGPLAPMVVLGGILPWAQNLPLHTAVAGAVALAHLFLLALPFGDGNALRMAVRDHPAFPDRTVAKGDFPLHRNHG